MTSAPDSASESTRDTESNNVAVDRPKSRPPKSRPPKSRPPRSQRSRWRRKNVLIGALLVISLGCTAILFFQVRSTRAELDELKGYKAALKGEQMLTANMTSKLTECAKERDQARAGIEAARTAACEGQKSMVEDLESQLQALTAQRTENLTRQVEFNNLAQRFNALIADEKLVLASDQGRMLIRLPGTAVFKSGSVQLSRLGQFVLMEVAIALRQLPDRKIRIGGHTDSLPLEGIKGKYRNNFELSSARAFTVMSFFLEAGLEPRNFSIVGYGPNQPIDDNRTDKGRQRNRRIELELVPNASELPWLFDRP